MKIKDAFSWFIEEVLIRCLQRRNPEPSQCWLCSTLYYLYLLVMTTVKSVVDKVQNLQAPHKVYTMVDFVSPPLRLLVYQQNTALSKRPEFIIFIAWSASSFNLFDLIPDGTRTSEFLELQALAVEILIGLQPDLMHVNSRQPLTKTRYLFILNN